jgi:HEAT repeat protein
MPRTLLVLLLAAAALRAEGEGCDEEAVVTMGGGDEETLEKDPVEEPPVEADPNRPDPVVVGEWQPPPLDEAAERRLSELRAKCDAEPGNAAARYDLADFLAEHHWLPHAEAEYLRCALVDKGSIRPWEGLLKVYGDRKFARAPVDEFFQRIVFQNGGFLVIEGFGDGSADWLPHEVERQRRTVKAYEALLERRPDDLARRRELVRALVGLCEWPKVIDHATRAVNQLPEDASMRYELAEALRNADRPDEAIAALEAILERAPDHAPACLRLARSLAIHRGKESKERVAELEKRGFFHLFIRKEIAPAPMREDTFLLARDLAGPAMAGSLWDEAMQTRGQRESALEDRERNYTRRWIYLSFPRSFHKERLATLEGLGRRSDPSAVATLLGFLWNLAGDERTPDPEWDGWAEHRDLVDAGIRAARGQGAVFFESAERFLAAAPDDVRRHRAVRLLRALGDPRAVTPLVRALEFDVEEEFSYGVAAGLEETGDPRAIDALAAAALDARRPVARREEAIEALAAFPDPRAVEAVTRLAKEEPFAMSTAYALYRLSGDSSRLGRFREWLLDAERAERAMRLVLQCEGERAEELLLFAFEASPGLLRPRALDELRKRFWTTAREKVAEIVLKECEGPTVPVETLRLLQEVKSPRAADRLAALVETLQGEAWAVAARAFAETGDARAVRYFNRVRVLSKEPGQRKLAEQLHETAARREAENRRAASEG